VLSSELLNTAWLLAKTRRGRGKPRQSDLRRAVSSSYYAIFHHLARSCADLMVGSVKRNRSKHAWNQVYRALEHGAAKNACVDGVIKKFPAEIQDFADTFRQLQEKRHVADYAPDGKLTLSEVLTDIQSAEAAMTAFDGAPIKDRTAFCTFVLFKKR
jgi:uncharacterized protein (UPF0332 family)